MNDIGASISSATASGLSAAGILYGMKMKRIGLSGCAACLSKNHVWNGSYEFCRELCPACGTNLRRTEHICIDCERAPRDKSEALQMAKHSDFNNDPDRGQSFTDE